jgi:hypothetical protein
MPGFQAMTVMYPRKPSSGGTRHGGPNFSSDRCGTGGSGIRDRFALRLCSELGAVDYGRGLRSPREQGPPWTYSQGALGCIVFIALLFSE